MWTIPFVAPESFGCSPNRNLNNSAKQTSTFRTGSSSCFWFFSPYFPIFPLLKCQSQKRDDLKTKCTIDPLNTPNVYRNFASPSLHYRSTCFDWFSLRFRQSLQFISAYFWKRVVVCFQKCWHNLLARHPAVQNNTKKKNMADLWWKRNVSKINELWCENGSRHWMETDVIRSHRQTLTSASITTVQKWDTFDYYFMIQSPSLIWKNWRSNTQWGLKVNVWRLSSTKRNAKKKKKKCFLCPFNSLKPTKLSIYTK